MPAHEAFEEMAALAAAGEISAADWPALKAHLEECAACRAAFRGSEDVLSRWLPQRRGFEMQRDTTAEARLRRKILRGAEAAGARFSPAAMRSSAPALARSRWADFRGILRGPLPAFAAGALLTGVGAWAVARTMLPVPAPAKPPVVVLQTRQPAGMAMALAQATASQETALEGERKLRQEIGQSRIEATQLEQQLEAAKSRASGLADASSAANLKIAALQRQLTSALSSESKAETDLAALRASRFDTANLLTLSDEQNRELRAQLAAANASLGRENALLSHGRDIRDLIAARNLHIIDVYDTNGSGKTAKSFGRVFYTQDKSLIFYAYDLPRQGANSARYEFTAWGKGDGTDAQARKLGIFFQDKKDRQRWLLEVTDPHILSQIDSVFVTLERTGRPVNSPRGKKLLSAFLGTPANHP